MSYWDKRWWHAQFFLGRKTIFHYLRKLIFWKKTDGLAQFRRNYVPESLPHFTPAHRAIAHEPGRCTTCGRCEAECPVVKNPQFLGPMRFVVSGLRGGTILFSITETLEIMTSQSCQGCQLCEQACPKGIPILQLAHHAKMQLGEVRKWGSAADRCS